MTRWTYTYSLADLAGTTPATGTARYYSQDNIGSTRRLRDASKGSLGQYEYEPYGADYSTSGASVADKFTGHDWDDTSDLYYAPYRYYAPNLARWISRDPLGMVDGPNIYAYVSNLPITRFDLDGRHLGVNFEKRHVSKWHETCKISWPRFLTAGISGFFCGACIGAAILTWMGALGFTVLTFGAGTPTIAMALALTFGCAALCLGTLYWAVQSYEKYLECFTKEAKDWCRAHQKKCRRVKKTCNEYLNLFS